MYWPFDTTAITVENAGDNKEFSVPTQAGQWIFTGQHIFSFQVEFVNAELNVFGNWPRGSCSGPFPIGMFYVWVLLWIYIVWVPEVKEIKV